MPLKVKVACLILSLLISAISVADDKFNLQESHQNISDQLVNLADSVDRIFGEPRATDQVNRTTLRLATYYDWTGRGPDNKGTEVRLNLRLPILERESKVVTDQLRFDNKNKSSTEPLSDDPTQFSPEDTIEDRLIEKSRWNLRTEPGVKVQSQASFFERARATKSFFTGKFVHNFSQELTWDSASQWDENTLIDSDYALTDQLLFRFRNQAEWAITDQQFFSYHGPFLIQKLGNLSAISYSALLTSQIQSSSWFADTYTLSANYRRSVYSNWAFLELTPALLFQKIQNFKGMTSFTARIEFLFGAI